VRGVMVLARAEHSAAASDGRAFDQNRQCQGSDASPDCRCNQASRSLADRTAARAAPHASMGREGHGIGLRRCPPPKKILRRSLATTLELLSTKAHASAIRTAHRPRSSPVVPRPGQINAWDNAEFVAAVKATGR
jgi:hypothetical protein